MRLRRRWWTIFKFPDPSRANPDGLLMVGGDIEPEMLKSAYSQGVFPWPQPGYPPLWFSPPERGVLEFKNFKIPKSTAKKIKQKHFEIRWNQNFRNVMENCAKVPRGEESGTWILPEMLEAYESLAKEGLAISVEAYRDKLLVGGLYGVLIHGVFSGESMFFKESEASKVCLVHLVERLKNEGHDWIDIQMVTPLLEQFGGKYIDRVLFLKWLKERQDAYQ